MRLASFVSDITPPIGSPLCLGLVPPAIGITDRLLCKGVVLSGTGQPVVICALDWMGLRHGAHERWRQALSEAAGTDPDRVAVHTLHQHDAPGSDPDAEELMAALGRPGRLEDSEFIGVALAHVVSAVRASIEHATEVTEIGCGRARVTDVASNRRVLGPDGHVAVARYSATKDPAVRAAAEGVIDPYVRVISFWSGDRKLAVLSHYATHPQSHYREGLVTSDFVGLAREAQESSDRAVRYLHFCGAAGNVTVGKYNDGDPANREVLAGRLADGMRRATRDSEDHKQRIGDSDMTWSIREVVLPLAERLSDDAVYSRFEREPVPREAHAVALARRSTGGVMGKVACLQLGDVRILYFPGELFIEYELFAECLRPDLFIAVAAYGDLGPGYIGTRQAYSQGGYETGPASCVGPAAEDVLVAAVRELLDAPPGVGLTPSDFTQTLPGVPPRGRMKWNDSSQW